MTALLVVDWDFFFPMPHDDPHESLHYYDWGHSESWPPGVLDIAWTTRAANFLRGGRDLPTVQGWRDFWPRFQFTPDATLTYGNSNVLALEPPMEGRTLWLPRDFDSVWLYDQHHDSGYGHTPADLDEWDTATCEDWLIYFTRAGVATNVRYPRWYKRWPTVDREPDVQPTTRGMDGPETTPAFDHVFVCRSDAWVPPWCDDDFAAFIEACPTSDRLCLDNVADHPREFHLDDARAFNAQMEALRARTDTP